jgi:aspartate kinase
VDGVLSTNPTLVKEAFILDEISFDEVAELSHFGAKVLHPHSVLPALKAHIPIRILNTFNPTNLKGTRVTEKNVLTKHPFKSIAYKKGITIIRIATPKMLMAYGYMAKICDRFAQHKISIDLIATTELSVSLSVDEKPHEIKPLLCDLQTLGEVTTQGNQSIVSIVGSEMAQECHSHGRIFATLNRAKIKINMASIGNALINLSLVVKDSDCDQTVQLLHDEFFLKSI